MTLEADKPYYDLPLLPPQQQLESLELYKALVPAAEKLARLSATADQLPNQAALYQSVILLEAKASSAIEQVVTTDEKLFASGPSQAALDPITKEVHRYAEAIEHGWFEEKPLCTTVAEQLCTIIKDKEMTVRRVPGTALKRDDGQIIYTPPDGETLLRDLLDNLFAWMNADDDLHPIVKAAVAHYQFESIHPFTDGNGRTGRIMMVLYLVEQGLLSAPVLFLSGEILSDKEQYYSLLQSTRETDDFLPYVIWFVNTVDIAALHSILRAQAVRIAMLDVKNSIRSNVPRIYSQDLVNALFRGPIVFAKTLVDAGVAGSISTAHTYLKNLVDLDLLMIAPKRYARKTAYINYKLLAALKGDIDLG